MIRRAIEMSRRLGTLMAAAAGLAAVTAVACLVYMGSPAQSAAPAELLVRRLRIVADLSSTWRARAG